MAELKGFDCLQTAAKWGTIFPLLWRAEIETKIVASSQGMRGVYAWREESSFTVGDNCLISTKKKLNILMELTNREKHELSSSS